VSSPVVEASEPVRCVQAEPQPAAVLFEPAVEQEPLPFQSASA
jgi:hypothetical protein